MNWRIDKHQKKNILSNKGFLQKEKKQALHHIDLLVKYNTQTWDYQWAFSLRANNQLCIFPKVNMVTNIGGGEQATHTFSVKYIPSENIDFPLVHPHYICPDYTFDYLFYKKTNNFKNKIKRLIPFELKETIKKRLGKFIFR